MRNKKPARSAVRRSRSTILFASVIVSAALIGVAAAPVDIGRNESKNAIVGIHSNPPATEDPDRREDRDPPVRRDPTMPPGEEDGPEPPVIGLSNDHASTEERGQQGDPDGLDGQDPPMALGEADGVVPDGVTVTVFDDDVPAVANLDPDLLDALRWAVTDAVDGGFVFSVNSGWRSPDYQDQLLREAIVTYGSEEEAARWVATAETSAHVSGDAIDLGPAEASAWLTEHGAEYGLCQIYGNEPWHFELRPSAVEDGCPPMYADPTDDPRMQR